MSTTRFVDYYEILSLPETADEPRIKEAIRQQRRVWNKRAAQADPVQRSNAEQRIRDLAEAERVLTDPSARKSYDNTRVQNKAKAAAEATPAPTAEGRRNWLEEARRALAVGNAHVANYAAREAIGVNGADHEAWNIRANSSFLMGNYGDAEFEFREAIRLQPHNAGYHFDYGEAHAALGNWGDALAEYEIALRQAPGNPVYKTAIANVYLHTDKPDQALELMEEVVKAEPDEEVFQYYLALALHDSNLARWSKAVGGGLLITSVQQIRVTREMSGRALKLKFHDDALRASLRENLQLADKAEAKRWTSSAALRYYVSAVMISLAIMISGFGSGNAGLGVVGLLLAAIIVWVYVARHYKYGWQINAARSLARPGV